MNITIPESLKDYQLDVSARKIAKDISGKEYEQCSEFLRVKAYELAIQLQGAIMTANIAASMEDLIDAVGSNADKTK